MHMLNFWFGILSSEKENLNKRKDRKGGVDFKVCINEFTVDNTMIDTQITSI